VAKRLADEGPEDATLLGPLREVLGMPLHADTESRYCELDGLHDAVALDGHGAKSLSESIDSLPVQAVYAHARAPHCLREHAVGFEPHELSRQHAPGIRLFHVERFQAAVQRAAQLHVDELGSAADSEDGRAVG